MKQSLSNNYFLTTLRKTSRGTCIFPSIFIRSFPSCWCLIFLPSRSATKFPEKEFTFDVKIHFRFHLS